MEQNTTQLLEERLRRNEEIIAPETLDRVPVARASDTLAEAHEGSTTQGVMHDSTPWLESKIRFCRDFPAVDVLRCIPFWAPNHDTVGLTRYPVPGEHLPMDTPHSPCDEGSATPAIHFRNKPCYNTGNTNIPNNHAMPEASLVRGWFIGAPQSSPLLPLPAPKGAPEMNSKARLAPWSPNRARKGHPPWDKSLIQISQAPIEWIASS